MKVSRCGARPARPTASQLSLWGEAGRETGLEPRPAGRMCLYRVRLGSVADVDAEVIAWVRAPYDVAG